MNNRIKEEGLTNAYLLGKYEGIKQGRADAIEEFLKLDKECQERDGECDYISSDIYCVECIAQQIKK